MVSEKDKQALKKSSRMLGGFGVVVGLLCILIGVASSGAFWLSLVGFVFLFGGVLIIQKGPEYGEAYLKRQEPPIQDEDNHTADFIQDKRGIIWVWIVAAITWVLMAVAWFTLSIVGYAVIDAVEAMPYNYPQAYLDNITLARDVLGWFLIIMTIGIIGWALISSARRVDDTGLADNFGI